MKAEEKQIFLSNANPDHYFRVVDGTIIRGILELDMSLENMGAETFSYHVNEYRNDFSAWIRETFKDEKLANQLLLARDKCRMQVLVLRRTNEVLSEKDS